MSDPYAQHPHYAPPGPGPEANFYAPADSVYQNPPYDYEPQNPYTQQSPPNQNYQYDSQYDLAQTPRSYPPQMSGPQQDYLNPASAGGFEQENNHRGTTRPPTNKIGTILQTLVPKKPTTLPTMRELSAILQGHLLVALVAMFWDAKVTMVF
ncbi:hypothetical protein AFCA_010664 [Aspergillus flavus]|nr:hypothetical protein AFCA_010664 [Aspergillus flavus]